MSFIRTVSPEEAQGLLKDLYDADLKSTGYVPHYSQAMSLNPEAMGAWRKLMGAIRGKMRLRTYELVTFATAMALRCTYWLLAHGAVLRKNFFTADQIIAIVRDYHTAGLEPGEVAIMDYAQKVANDAGQTSAADFLALRQHGFSDEAILNITLTAAARCFFSKALDALGAEPDETYRELEPELVAALQGSRPFQE